MIGNPPYVSVKAISEEDKRTYSNIYYSGSGRFNLFTLFIEQSFNLLKNSGQFAMIIPEGIFSNIEYRFSREILATKTKINRICVFTKRVFDASVDTAIITFAKAVQQNKTNDIYVDVDVKKTNISLSQQNIIDFPYYLIPAKISGIDKKIIDDIVLSKSYDSIGNNFEIQQGIIYSGQAREDVFADKILNPTYKPILDGRDIVKWRINWDIKDYARYLSYTNKLHRPREERLFLADKKILIPRRATNIIATIDMEQYYVLNTAYICLLKNDFYSIEFILGLLNSKLLDFIYCKLFMGWQITIPALNILPIPKIDTLFQRPIVSLVKQILSIKKTNRNADVSDLEYEIDQLVYQLYGLTDDEIKAVEGN